jgi:hypothetical protein
VGAAIQPPTGLDGCLALRTLVTVADPVESVGREPESLEDAGGALGASVAKRKVVRRGAPFVAVALDDDLQLRKFAKKRREDRGVLAQTVESVGGEFRAVVREIGIDQ